MISERGETRLFNANAKHQQDAKAADATDYGFDKGRRYMLKYPTVSNEHHTIAAAVKDLDAASRLITTLTVNLYLDFIIY
jgi:hypothetical protein